MLLLVALLALPSAALAQQTGSCELGTAEKDLDVNNVLARAFNTGSLFYGNTSEAAYIVPISSGNSPFYASGIWIGGEVNGQFRVAGSTYTLFEFWPGPIVNGQAPADCSVYDRIWKVSEEDILNYESTGNAVDDLAEWPAELGAPVIAAPDNGIDDDGDGLVDEGTDGKDNDGDGSVDERDEIELRTDGGYDLAAGDRPDLIGDQTLWWVMNDLGNQHERNGTDPLGVEVQVQAWAFARSDALGETTFYRYRVINKSDNVIENTYLSIFSDPDLGDAGDDLVGSDTSLSLGFVYNAGETDAAYGVPPAAGYDFFQGPIVDADGEGVANDTLGLTGFSYFENAQGPTADPVGGQDYYYYMQGLWADGTPMTEGGNGYQTTGPVTRFAFPGDPVQGEFWSEVNNDNNGTENPGGDRRFLTSTGPFTMNPGDQQDIVFGAVFAQGADRFSSISALRAADRLAQTAYDIDFELPSPPPPPPLCSRDSDNPALRPGSGSCLQAATMDGEAALVWGYPENSSNYLGNFEEFDRLLSEQDVPDKTYNFEGFNIYRYPTSQFASDQATLIATIDKANGVGEVIDERFDPEVGQTVPFVAARGSDTGLRYYYNLGQVTNYTDYFYAITAYSYNEFSTPKVVESAPSRIVVRPADVSAGQGGSVAQSEFESTIPVQVENQLGEGEIAVRVVDPTAVTGDTYRVEFFETTIDDGDDQTEDEVVIAYNIINASTGDTVFDGSRFVSEFGQAPPQKENVLVIDGLSFDILGPDLAVTSFEAVANAAGPIEPPTGGSADFADYPVPERPGDSQQSTTDNTYFVGGAEALTGHTYGQFLANAFNPQVAIPSDWEIRFTGDDNKGAIWSRTGTFGEVPVLIDVPFQIWDIGNGTPDDPSDDVRYFPTIFDLDFSVPPGGQQFSLLTDFGIQTTFACCSGDSQMSSATNDPYTDGFSWIRPDDVSPGESGYESIVSGIQNDPGSANTFLLNSEKPFERMGITAWNLGEVCTADENEDGVCDNDDVDYDVIEDLPEEGTVFRLITSKPNLPGDVFSINTSEAALLTDQQDAVATSIDRIGIVPNPYVGASGYETDNLDRTARFINLPDQARIRIYTVSGTLVREIVKDGPERSVDWDLTTFNNLPIASGMYLIHIEVPGVGERVLKFGVVNRKNRIEVF